MNKLAKTKPQRYSLLDWQQRRQLREDYVRTQGGNCHHCNEPISGKPSASVLKKKIDWTLFPDNFLKYPCHLHHNHDTDMTIGAVHAYCNAVLWQYYGE